MKKIFLILFMIMMITTACSSTDDNIVDNEKTPDSIMFDSEEEVDEEIDTDGSQNLLDNPTEDIAIGLESPDFTLTNLDGEEVSLSDYRGKIVIINFWATWCHWCDIEMPDLNKVHMENEDIVVLAVNVMEDEDTVRTYIEDGGYGFEVVLDTDGKIASDYLVNGLPNSYFVDKDGILQFIKVGMITNDELLYVVDAIREYHEENN
ncbi:MAG: TlpA family protein disulfide reductase [Tissierella sp.]|nr:TlpA family protein disulfide reductase [Tissierella sp.]